MSRVQGLKCYKYVVLNDRVNALDGGEGRGGLCVNELAEMWLTDLSFLMVMLLHCILVITLFATNVKDHQHPDILESQIQQYVTAYLTVFSTLR